MRTNIGCPRYAEIPGGHIICGAIFQKSLGGTLVFGTFSKNPWGTHFFETVVKFRTPKNKKCLGEVSGFGGYTKNPWEGYTDLGGYTKNPWQGCLDLGGYTKNPCEGYVVWGGIPKILWRGKVDRNSTHKLPSTTPPLELARWSTNPSAPHPAPWPAPPAQPFSPPQTPPPTLTRYRPSP